MADYGHDLIGKVVEAPTRINVTAELIANFCTAIGETNPLYTDHAAAMAGPYGGLVAPPSIAANFRVVDHMFEHLPRFGTRRLAGGIDIEFVAPIRAGDTITFASQLKEIYEKTGRSGSMIFFVIRSTLTNHKGEVVAHLEHRFMSRP